ncbi:MAG: hypothetical protein SCK29_08820 [Bacillota bacterium]|nr:hypothetical protein [Bacillota bacterium]MDW7684201.1 hypothetical protein [Bacillota bacterium]
MTDRTSRENFLQTEIHEGMAIGLWKGLGFKDSELTPHEMLNIMNAKINSGEISLEQIKAVLDLVGEEGKFSNQQ